MSGVPYHAWTHRPKALGGTDPIEVEEAGAGRAVEWIYTYNDFANAQQVGGLEEQITPFAVSRRGVGSAFTWDGSKEPQIQESGFYVVQAHAVFGTAGNNNTATHGSLRLAFAPDTEADSSYRWMHHWPSGGSSPIWTQVLDEDVATAYTVTNFATVTSGLAVFDDDLRTIEFYVRCFTGAVASVNYVTAGITAWRVGDIAAATTSA